MGYRRAETKSDYVIAYQRHAAWMNGESKSNEIVCHTQESLGIL